MDQSAIAIIALTVGLPLVIMVWALGQFRKDTAGIKNGIAAAAVGEGGFIMDSVGMFVWARENRNESVK